MDRMMNAKSIMHRTYRRIKFGRSVVKRYLADDFYSGEIYLNINDNGNGDSLRYSFQDRRMITRYPFLVGDEKGFDERFNKWIGGKK